MPKRKKTPTKSQIGNAQDFSPEEIVMLSAFESVKLTFEIENTTTNTKVRDTSQVRLIELQDRGMTLELPIRACAQGHSLMLKIKSVSPDKKCIEIMATAKVDLREPIEESGFDRIQVSLIQFDETGWTNFCALFSSRQDDIEKFLMGSRGY